VFDEFGFIDAFGGGGADIAPIAFDSGSIADTAWTPSLDSSMMSPEMAMGGAGGFDGQMSDIVGALASAGRFDLIPPVMEAAGFDMSGPDPLAPLASSPSEATSQMPEAAPLETPSLVSLMLQTPEAPPFMAPWNPMGDLGQSQPMQTPLIINPEQQYATGNEYEGQSYQNEIRNTQWYKEFTDRYGEQPNLNDPNYDYRSAWESGARPDVRDPGDGQLHWPSDFKGPDHPNRFVDGIDTTTGIPQQSPFDEGGFSIPPFQHNDGGPMGSQGVTDQQPDFSWVFGGQPEVPADTFADRFGALPQQSPASVVGDHFKDYQQSGAQSFDEGGFSPQPLGHSDGGAPGMVAGLSDGPTLPFEQQEQVPLPMPRPYGYDNSAAVRSYPVTHNLESKIADTATNVYGPGSRGVIFSGGQKNPFLSAGKMTSDRHNLDAEGRGQAADVKFYDPQGKLISNPAAAGQYWASQGWGGAAAGMPNGGIHLDQHTDKGHAPTAADAHPVSRAADGGSCARQAGNQRCGEGGQQGLCARRSQRSRQADGGL
jgi:hypothetical protein